MENKDQEVIEEEKAERAKERARERKEMILNSGSRKKTEKKENRFGLKTGIR